MNYEKEGRNQVSVGSLSKDIMFTDVYEDRVCVYIYHASQLHVHISPN